MALSSTERYDVVWVRPSNVGVRRKRNASKVRQVFAPCEGLKKIQLAISRVIADSFYPHPIAHAYTRHRSIITNAQTHLGAKTLLHVDLVAFFASIKQPMVVNALRGVLGGLSSEIVAVIADLCCRDGSLPQGSPASPVISNLVCHPLDAQLTDLVRCAGCSVGRYSDDIGISTTAAAFPQEIAKICNGKVELGQRLVSIVEERGFNVNWEKVRFQTRQTGLRATGLVVGDRVSVPQKFRDNVRAALHRWSRDGIGDAADRCHPGKSEEAFVQWLRGSIDFVGQVHGRDSTGYQCLSDVFRGLIACDPPKLVRRGTPQPTRNPIR
ncbi:reverse transcriptase family protein [Sphingomonas sp. RS2018]